MPRASYIAHYISLSVLAGGDGDCGRTAPVGIFCLRLTVRGCGADERTWWEPTLRPMMSYMTGDILTKIWWGEKVRRVN